MKKLIFSMVALVSMAGCAGGDGAFSPMDEETEEEVSSIRVSAVSLPRNVSRAVVVNHNLGRDSFDWGGVSEVRIFSVQNGTQATLKDALRTVLLRTKTSEKDGTTMSAYCKHEVGGDPAKSATACVNHILARTGSRAPERPYFLFVEGETDDEGTAFNESSLTILHHVEGKVGNGYREYNYCYGNVPNVDVCQTLLTSKDGKTIVLVNYDHGA